LSLVGPCSCIPDTGATTNDPKVEYQSDREQVYHILKQFFVKTFNEPPATMENLDRRLRSIDKLVQSVDDRLSKIEDSKKQREWYAGPVGFGLTLLLGLGGVFGFDYYRRKRTTYAYNSSGEDYFKNKEFVLSILSFRRALTSDPSDQRSRSNLVESLVRVEDEIIRGNMKNIHINGELSDISNRITIEIDMLKRHDKNGFVPWMLEGDWLQMRAKREPRDAVKLDLFSHALEKYGTAILKYRDSDSFYWREIAARMLF
jgi:hypothetical protein